MNYYVPQINDSDCGFACLKMLIATQYKDENALYIKQDENKIAYSFLELKEIAFKYGLDLNGIVVEDVDNVKQMKFPFIALIKRNDDTDHYIYVYKCKFGQVYYSDPSEGENAIPIKVFSELWTGKALVLENFERKEVNFDNALNNKMKLDFSSLFLQFLSAAFLLMGIYFINYEKIAFPLIFLSLFIVSEILFRFHLIQRMEKMDESFLHTIEVKRSGKKDFLYRYETYKKGVINQPIEIVFSIIVLLSSCFILLFNHLANTLLVITPLIIAIIETRLFNPYIKKKNQTISHYEKELQEQKHPNDFELVLSEIHVKAYRLSRISLIKKYLLIFLLIINSFAVSIYTGMVVLPYLAFNVFVSWMMYEQYMKLFNYPKQNRELIKQRVLLNNIISTRDW